MSRVEGYPAAAWTNEGGNEAEAAPPVDRELGRHGDLTEAVLHELIEQGALSAEQVRCARAHQREEGGDLLGALAVHGDDTAIWGALAARRELSFYSSHSDLKVMMAYLFDRETALRFQIVPHRRRGHELMVVTHDTTLDPCTIEGLGRVTLGLTTRRVWRHLFEIAYPGTLHGRLSLEEARSLAAYRPLGTQLATTAEQEAEALALSGGWRYVNPLLDPPDRDAAHAVERSTAQRLHVYPYAFEGDRLVLLTTEPTDGQMLTTVRLMSQCEIVPVVASHRAIATLLQAAALRD